MTHPSANRTNVYKQYKYNRLQPKNKTSLKNIRIAFPKDLFKNKCKNLGFELYRMTDMMTILGQAGTLDKKVNSFYEKGCGYLRIYRPGIFTET